ncbi:MAG: acetate kinase [Bifidobacteriaceae bacterium]|jgi:acetate kinase|nr:acetate kinase [Bifidobacteriaceae bacterium]
METVLVINAGSSSIKYQLVDVDTREALASGIVERIGEAISPLTHKAHGEKHSVEAHVPDHTTGLRGVLKLFEKYGPDLSQVGLVGVGHRVVQGADEYSHATVITPEVLAKIVEFSPLAPLHNPANIQGIEAARAAFPALPQVAVFDTAFHATLPPEAYTYAIDPGLAKEFRIRRYGFHGTSHQYVSRETAKAMGRPVEDVNIITVHIGSGCSMAAVRGGHSVETSMGLTPLEGLVMGSRCGDLDPAIVFHLVREAGLDIDQIDTLFNKKSGLLGMCGSLDVRDIHKAIGEGDPAAKLAFDVFTHRLRQYIGGYCAQLGRVDAIAFTAGIGENDPISRAAALRGLEVFGIELDQDKNQAARGAALISADSSRTQVWVMPTNEEYEIAHQTAELIDSLAPATV